MVEKARKRSRGKTAVLIDEQIKYELHSTVV